jgi:hypothetical protein
MSTQPSIILVGAVLALTVLGCRNERTYDSDETTPPAPVTPSPTEQTPPLIEGEDALEGESPAEDRDERDPNEGEAPPSDSIDPGVDPEDREVPEAGAPGADPGADPKQPPPPSSGTTKRASRD